MLHIPSVLTLQAPSAPRLPLIIDSPHSGRLYPTSFTSDLSPQISLKDLRCAEDSLVDTLFSESPRLGAYLLQAHFPRSYIDLNRRCNDLDLNMIEEAEWPKPLYPSEKTKQGFGLIWRLSPSGLPLYKKKLTERQVQMRIDNYWQPYHHTLKTLYDRLQGEFGSVFHLNCHSMPKQAEDADFVVGDLDGKTCAPDMRECVVNFLERIGFTVSLNDPYRGGHLIEVCANKNAGRHALQLEVNRALYFDPHSSNLSPRACKLKASLNALVEELSCYVLHKIARLLHARA